MALPLDSTAEDFVWDARLQRMVPRSQSTLPVAASISAPPAINGQPFGLLQRSYTPPYPAEFYAPGYQPTDTTPPIKMPPGYDQSWPQVASLDPGIAATLDRIAAQYGLDPALFRGIAQIESGGDPHAGAGGPYQGLFQLSPQEFAKTGGQNVFDPVQNATAAAANLASERQQFVAKFGRAPNPTELYLIHQQGFGGLTAQLTNPTALAWQNMASTGEGQQKGPAWAKQAIWGNVPDDIKARFPGGVDSLTGQQFIDLWNGKVAAFTGGGTGALNPAPGAPNALLAAASGGGLPKTLTLANLLGQMNANRTPLAVVPTGTAAGPSATGPGPTATPNLLAAQVRPTPLLNPFV